MFFQYVHTRPSVLESYFSRNRTGITQCKLTILLYLVDEIKLTNRTPYARRPISGYASQDIALERRESDTGDISAMPGKGFLFVVRYITAFTCNTYGFSYIIPTANGYLPQLDQRVVSTSCQKIRFIPATRVRTFSCWFKVLRAGNKLCCT